MPQSDPDAALNVVHAGVREAAQALRQGQLVGFPTETVYVIAASPLHSRGVEKLVELQQV
jgi:tRNA A37 threonylcarbamoyladenosine synthetase subunit TsaC/SUA5/YrdC